MERDSYPVPTSDPEALGLPGTADDESSADPSPQDLRDGPDPATLPGDEPAGIERFGTTAGEMRHGRPLSERLAEEEPDVAPSDRPIEPEEIFAPPVHQRLGTPVSLYDEDTPDTVGRLVAPDEGGLSDTEPDLIAADAGTAGGGPTAEEAAMHVVPEVEPPDWAGLPEVEPPD